MGRFFAFATFIAGGLIIADLWAKPKVTNNVVNSSTKVAGYLAGK